MITAAQKLHGRSSTFKALLWAYACIFYFVLYAPLVIIGVLSFNKSRIVGFPLTGVSTVWYRKIFDTPEFISALMNSLGVGVVSALIATFLALLLALGFRRDFPLKNLLFNVVLAPVVMPGIVGGIVLLLFFGYLHMQSSLYTTVLVAHINWILPFAFLTLYPRVQNFDRSLEEAAADLGARPSEVFRYIVFPIIRPAFVATTLFSFSLSFDEFIRTLFVTGFDRTIPVMFWSMIVDELAPELPAMSIVIIVISATVSMIGAFVLNRIGSRNTRAK